MRTLPPIVFALAFLAAVSAARAKEVEGLRTWTSSGGKTLEAALVSLERGEDKAFTVTMKRRSGQVFDLPLTKLSDADQSALKAWLKRHPVGVAKPIPPFVWPSKFSGSATPDVVEAGIDSEDGYHRYTTKYFDIHVDEKVGKTTISQCVAVFESIVGALESLPLGLDTVPAADKPRYKVVLVSSREGYAKLGGMVNSGGFYSPRRNLTVIPFRSLGIEKKGSSWGFDGKNRSFETLIHELTHHSMGRKWSALPVWVTEGIADYLSAMPYRSGQFLFTNTGKSVSAAVRKAYKGTTWERHAMPKGVFQMTKPAELFITSHRQWSQTLAMSAVHGSINYNSSVILAYYFMQEDASGRGEHFIPWLHEVRSSGLTEREQFGERYQALLEKHLLRGRSYDELEEDIAEAMQKKGLRIAFKSRGK